ncbi:MAG: hypothetical protein M3O87_06355 [Candidatus Dormibacteraeota bacterium]|nr:hypothetical protein [Candidatus Dormibacteraeota bacterium]
MTTYFIVRETRPDPTARIQLALFDQPVEALGPDDAVAAAAAGQPGTYLAIPEDDWHEYHWDVEATIQVKAKPRPEAVPQVPPSDPLGPGPALDNDIPF